MSKDDNSTGGGLLSKVVRFVRNPTSNWTELDSVQDDRDSQYSKQMLKEMIERKRRNDFVRRREFDQLRKLRRREALQGQRTEDPTARPSFFQSSMASPDERAVTLKKIDEIEAQMSQQWWKSKQGNTPSSFAPAGASTPEEAQAIVARAFAPTAPASLPPHLATQGPVEPLFAGDTVPPEGGAHTVPATTPPWTADTSPMDAALAFGNTEPGALDAPVPALPLLEKFVHEPDLEEAAIRFANGDYAGAESGLLEVLAQHQDDAPEQQTEIWLTLFDLYRATGQHDRFDALAIDYAARFSRSAPVWFSLPEQLGLSQAAAPAEPVMARRDLSWNAPSSIATSTVTALQASLDRAAPPWTLVWSRLQSIDEPAVRALAEQFNRWAERAGQFHFQGAEHLLALLERQTPSGDRAVSADWWRLRMSVLRLMGRAEDFEMVALDYCVTYEVSPPSWEPARCSYSDDAEPRAEAARGPDSRDMLMSDFGALSMPAPLDAGPSATLSGHIEGDVAPLLEPFEAHLRPGMPFQVHCDQLIRMDFAAAGSLLNWAASRQAEGYELQFLQLHRLVAVLLNVIGVNEHAWIVPRRN
ncbi:STAS domain-containing protein [Acidovorax lacteus]|uniref:MlaB-like STAS domain-containing protein n=1 Tax=Acidovorax lacteus TaxID=1924988 RepID=A0ABP8KZN0_9BURK